MLDEDDFLLHRMMAPDDERWHRTVDARHRRSNRWLSYLILGLVVAMLAATALRAVSGSWSAVVPAMTLPMLAGWWFSVWRGQAGSTGQHHRANPVNCSLYLRDDARALDTRAATIRAEEWPGPVAPEHRVEYARLEILAVEADNYRHAIKRRMALLEQRTAAQAEADDETDASV